MEEFKKAWGPLLAATIGTMCGLITVTNYTQGLFFGPVSTEFGWAPGQFFLSFTVMMCAGLITAPIVGSLAAKYGLKKLGVIGLIGHALGYFLISLNPNSFPLWVASWALLAVMAAGSLPIIWTSVLNGWFVKHRGQAIGITMAGTGLGAFLYPPIVEYFISNHGWRAGYQAIGFGALLLSLPIVLLLFKEKEVAPKADNISVVHHWGFTRVEAMGKVKFWILGVVLFLTVFAVVAILSNFDPILEEKGLSRATVASIILPVLGITVILGRLLVGALVDRFWAPGVASVFFILPLIAIFILVNVETTLTTSITVAILVGLAAGAELDLLAYLTSKYFGPKHYAKIFGAIFTFFTVGAGISPPIFGQMARNVGSYDKPLLFIAALLVLSIVFFLMLGRYPEQEKLEH